MKNLFTLFIVLGITLTSFAQFKLSGKIDGTVKADTFYINIPYIYDYSHDNDVAIPVDANGNFDAIINIKEQKFGNIRFENKAVYLLLTPGKSLFFNYSPSEKNITFNGTAAAENRLPEKLGLNNAPFFLKDSTYASLNLAQLDQQVVTPWAAICDNNEALVRSAPLLKQNKELILQEVKANYLLQLNYFARGTMDRTYRKRIDSFILGIYNDVPLEPRILPAGPIYYNLANSFIAYKQTEIFSSLPPDKTENPSTFLPLYNLTIDSGNRVAKLKGKPFLNWMLVHNTFPKNIAEDWLAQSIVTTSGNKDLAFAKPLLGEMIKAYPQSRYLPYLSAKVKTLEQLLIINRANKDIVIADGYDKMTSIYQAISKLKGKVIYLDMWGTWCGPCKEELRYNPALKQQFAGKDVAFVYLDMDDDARDSSWREFIKVNGITGLHLRKNSKAMEQFWDELLPKGAGTRYYPTYFIFNKEGKLVKADAKKPSDKSELYQQIKQYL